MEKTIYTKHEDKNQLHISREFDADIKLVWRVWTEAELLEQWLAPKPWKAEVKYMDFSVGGYCLYSMNGPEGEKHWGRTDYTHIEVERNYVADDIFCDEEGNKNSDIPPMNFDVKFYANTTSTKVEVVLTFVSKEAMEEIIKMGFKEGYAMAHENLDQVLKTIQSQSK